MHIRRRASLGTALMSQCLGQRTYTSDVLSFPTLDVLVNTEERKTMCSTKNNATDTELPYDTKVESSRT